MLSLRGLITRLVGLRVSETSPAQAEAPEVEPGVRRAAERMRTQRATALLGRHHFVNKPRKLRKHIPPNRNVYSGALRKSLLDLTMVAWRRLLAKRTELSP